MVGQVDPKLLNRTFLAVGPPVAPSSRYVLPRYYYNVKELQCGHGTIMTTLFFNLKKEVEFTTFNHSSNTSSSFLLSLLRHHHPVTKLVG